MKRLFALWLFCAPVKAECVKASWYDIGGMTTAHKTLPLGTRLKVTHNNKSVTVRVADRGPFIKGRVLDLSRAAAQKLGMIHKGVGTVCYERL